MATNFPTSLDTLTNPTATDTLDSPSHSSQHANSNDAIEALEAKVGADSSAVTTSHDYKLGGVSGTDKAASLAGTETLTNKTLTSPKLNEAVAVTSTATEVNILDGATLSTTELNYVTGVTSAIQTQLDTKISASSSDTLTNKTIDANGTGNSITNIETPDIATATLVTEADGIGSNDNDTTWPTSAAVKDYVDSISTGSIKLENSGGTSTLGTSSTTEQNVFQVSISAATLGTSGAIGFRVYVTDFDLANNQNCAVRLKYGSTTVLTSTITSAGGGDETDSTGYFDGHLIANASTSAQRGGMSTMIYGASALSEINSGTSAEDSTSTLNFTLSIQFSGSSANNAFTYAGYTVYKIV